jgi:hypothetical protein
VHPPLAQPPLPTEKNCVPPKKQMASYLTWQQSWHEMAAELYKLDGTQKK